MGIRIWTTSWLWFLYSIHLITIVIKLITERYCLVPLRVNNLSRNIYETASIITNKVFSVICSCEMRYSNLLQLS